MQEMAKQLQDMNSAMVAMKSQLDTSQTTNVRLDSEVTRLEKRITAAQGISEQAIRESMEKQKQLEKELKEGNHKGQTEKSLVDIRGIGKPAVFDSDISKYPTWSFKFTNFVTSVFPNARACLEWAVTCEHEIKDEAIKRQPSRFVRGETTDRRQLNA